MKLAGGQSSGRVPTSTDRDRLGSRTHYLPGLGPTFGLWCLEPEVESVPRCYLHRGGDSAQEQLSNVVDDGLLRRLRFAPPHRQTAPRRSPSLTEASRLTASTSSRPIPSA